MNESFWGELGTYLAEGGRAFLVVVVDHTAHSPGSRGAKLFVREDGTSVGTIGGGVMEANVLARARNADTPRWRALDLHHRRRVTGDGTPSGLICAGRQRHLEVRLGPDAAETLLRFATLQRTEAEEAELVVNEGEMSIVARPVDPQHGPRRHWPEGFAEHAINHRRVVILGGGHCGLALSRALRALGYRVRVVETRSEAAIVGAHDPATVTVVDAWDQVADCVDYPALSHVVVMTAAAHSDIDALRGLADVATPFLGLMGSPAKLRFIREALVESGHERVWSRVTAPVGLPMVSDTPAEIAVSISAQLLRSRPVLFPWERPARAT
ncbi:MAG: XdhC family protein [Myxococcota bacterium]